MGQEVFRHSPSPNEDMLLTSTIYAAVAWERQERCFCVVAYRDASRKDRATIERDILYNLSLKSCSQMH